MSEVRLVIRDARRDIHADRHGGFAEAVVAALSDGPETIEQLEAALERFHAAPKTGGFFRGFRDGIDDRPWDAGTLIVDLAARLVVCQSTYSHPGTAGCVFYHDGSSLTDVQVRYHISEDWLIDCEVDSWRDLADRRRRDRQANPPLDARAVLYGQALLEFVARECLQAFRGEPPQAPGSEAPAGGQWADLPREIHARWLTTPRDDLRGQAPRDVMLARHDHVDWSLQDRATQWSMGRPPRPLDFTWPTFRLGGFGTHEMVTYYELVRELIWACRGEVAGRTRPDGAPDLTAAEFLETELPRLARLRDEWLDRPAPDFGGRTPRGIIHNERIRMPEAMTGEEAVVDDDCPLCQMHAEMDGPVFWHLDGCNMDDDFAFSFHRTYEQWQEERRKHEEFSRRWQREEAERERLGVKYPGEGWRSPEAAWDGDGCATSPGQLAYLRLFTIGSSLCELTVALKGPPEQRGLIDSLSRGFGNLRAVCQTEDGASGAALIDPVLERFRETLDEVAAAREDLEEQCRALQDRLSRFLQPPREPGDGADEADFGLPQ